MSNYRSIAIDFPSRIADLLTTFEESAVAQGREVTLLLALAASAITVPIERLEKSHPSHDRSALPELADLITQLKTESFLGSQLWPGTDPKSWCFGGPLQTTEGDPDSWPELLHPESLNSDPTSWQILRHLRNALSHGNIYTRGRPDIRMIVFLSWVSFSDFRIFMDFWFSVLEPIHLPSCVIPELSLAASQVAD